MRHLKFRKKRKRAPHKAKLHFLSEKIHWNKKAVALWIAEIESIDDARMGLAVLVDQENCLNFQGLRCDVCYRECPKIDEAITLELERNTRTGKHARFLPTVHSDACTGCGK